MLLLYASELAASIGRHRYQSMDSALLKVWRRTQPESYAAAQARTQLTILTPEQHVSALQLEQELAAAIAAPSSKTAQTIEAVLQKPVIQPAALDAAVHRMLLAANSNDTLCPIKRKAAVLAECCSSAGILTPAATKRVCAVMDAAPCIITPAAVHALVQSLVVADVSTKAEAVRTVVQTARGCRGEAGAVQAYEKQQQTCVTQRNNKFYKLTVHSSEAVVDSNIDSDIDTDIAEEITCVRIGGRIDGLTEEGRLVEVKCRQNRFFTALPDYERVQIMAYMALVGAETCDLVQQYNGAQKVDTYAFDEEDWQTMCDAAVHFAQKVAMLLRSTEMQDRLLQVQA